jgi:hypothetical protein
VRSATTTLRMILLGEDKSAGKALKGVGTEADKSASKMDKFHKVGTAAGVALAGGLALAGKAAFDMTKRAAEDQQASARLAQTLHKTTGATKEQQTAVESWITAQGKAKGFSDDELRPSLSKLVVATGSVAKAQKLAAMAMDISTGTGKSLESVSFALAKAQNGNVSGLARLGVQTTKTTGDTMALEKAQTAVKSAQLSYNNAVKAYGPHSAQARIAADKLKQAHEGVGMAMEKTKKTTLSLDEISKNLASTYGGAASKNAETAAGKQKIMAVQMGELQEQIGTALIPVMAKLVSIGLKVIDWISKNTKLVGIIVAGLGALLAVTWAVSAATKAWAAITKVATAAQWLFNAAMDANPLALVAIAVIALGVAMVVAYKKSETFRHIVQAAFHGIQAAASAVADFFTHKIPAAFNRVTSAAGSVIGWVKGHWPLLLAILSGPFGLAVLAIAKNWDRIKAGASNAVSAITGILGRLVGFVTGMPSKIGRAAVGMFDGIKNAFQSSINWLIDKWNGLSFSLPSFNTHIPGVGTVGGFSISPPNIPRLAKGGIVSRPTLAMIGEAGPEAVVPLSGRNGFGGMGSGGDLGTFTLVVKGPGPREQQTALLKLKRENGNFALGLA